MNTLEKITSETCAIKLQVMKMAYIPTDLERCRGCEHYQSNYNCNQFKPYNFNFSVRQGGIVR